MLVPTQSRGFSTVELLIGMAVLVTIVVAVSVSLQGTTWLAKRTSQATNAFLMLEEGAEAVQLLRDVGWDSTIDPLSLGTPYYLVWNGSTYTATTTPTAIGGYYRTVTFRAVSRDGSGRLDEGGSTDSDSRYFTVAVTRVSDSTPLGTVEGIVHNSYE